MGVKGLSTQFDGMVTRVTGAFADYCAFVTQFVKKLCCENSKLKYVVSDRVIEGDCLLVFVLWRDKLHVVMRMCDATISLKS